MNIGRLPAFLALIAVVLLSPREGFAQLRPPADGFLTPSIGQPGPWHWTAGGAFSGARAQDETTLSGELRIALARDLGNPVMGLGSFQLEPFLGTGAGQPEGGLRARLTVPFLRFGVGVRQQFADPDTRWFISVLRPTRRGGVFGDGSMLRFDLSPGPNPILSLGLEKPIQRRLPPGKSRPRRDYVRLSAARVEPAQLPESPSVSAAVAEARERAAWIGRVTVPWLDHRNGNRPRSEDLVLAQISSLRRTLSSMDASGVSRPRLVEDEVRRFHAAMERAFAGALTPAAEEAASSQAAEVAAQARTLLLDEVLLPYDRLLGQVKVEDTTHGFARRARGLFLRWLLVESSVPSEQVDGVLGVFVAMLDIVEENRAQISAEWRDSRYVWLPLQYALLPEEHDTQMELDALVERATGELFTEGNSVSYVINEQAQFQFARMIHAARDYHVLWLHDFRGIDDFGKPDEQSYRHVLNSYLRAMTERVREYDSTGTFPTYLILIDQWFSSVRAADLWLDLLEDPMRHEVRLPRAFASWEDTLRIYQDSLRAAVANSRLLQAQRAEYGDRWLFNLVKVQVNVMYQVDWSFQSRRYARGLSVADNALRDHRKISFYDLTEEDPYRGEAMFTGAGVGENYSNLSWEDRSLLLRGPAALHLKATARQGLLDQGLDPTRIPWVLQPRERAADYDARVLAETARARRARRAVGVHNVTGYGPKDVNVAKAVLYTLMPPGSVIKVPDSLWNSAFWGAALAGCALRGGRVLVIAPAKANSPVPAFGSAEHSYELMWRLMAVARELKPELAERGGLLRVGIFASTIDVTDVPGKVVAVQRTFEEQEWLRDLFGFPPSVWAGLPELVSAYGTMAPPRDPGDFESEDAPKLHLKANLFASREAWTVMSRPEWLDMTWEFVQQRIAQVQARPTAVGTFGPNPDAMLDVGDGPVQAWYDGLAPADRDRVVFYTMIGSHNHNARSFVTDGEVVLVVSAWPSVIPYLDLLSIVGLSAWPERVEEMAALLPPQKRFKTRVSHWLRMMF